MKICILLSTYNGACYIDELLESLYKQTVRENMVVMIRDDGSTDNTVDKISKWFRYLNIKLYKGKNKGPKESFHELLKKASEADYYAYCDQDDVWKENKLEKAINSIEEKFRGNIIPVLYSCKMDCVDVNRNALPDINNLSRKDITLERIFVSNMLMGCTMVFNKYLKEEILKISFEHFYMHDVITVMIAFITGYVIYDNNAYIYYRQQPNSVTQKKAQKFSKKIKNSFIFWFKNSNYSISKQAQDLYHCFKKNISHEAQEVLLSIIKYRKGINRFKIVVSRRYRSNKYKENRSFIIRILLGLA